MKKSLSITIALVMLFCGLCSCGKDKEAETTKNTTQATSSNKEIIEVSYNGVDWDDVDFNKSIDRIAAYTETDIMALASGSAKGVAKAAGCTFEEAWDASFEVVNTMQEKAIELKGMLVLGHSTWSTSDKEKALILASDFIAALKEINGYMDTSGTTLESEILNVMNENAAKTTTTEAPETEPETVEETEPEPEPEPEPVHIDWNNTSLINNIKAFAEYDTAKLNKVVNAYAKGYAIETGYDEKDVKSEIKDIVKEAKNNAALVVQFLSFKPSWTDEVEEAASAIAAKFVSFAEDFQRYSKIVSEYEAAQKAEEETTAGENDDGSETPPADNIDEEGSDENADTTQEPAETEEVGE